MSKQKTKCTNNYFTLLKYRRKLFKRQLPSLIVSHFSANEADYEPEYLRAALYIRQQNKMVLYPDPRMQKHLKEVEEQKPHLTRCTEKNLLYADFKGRKLYFPSTWNYRKCQKALIALYQEQASFSPHCYTSPDFEVQPGATLIDIGSADGSFGLQYIETLSRLILFECQPDWIEALEATFEPWKEKVTIVRKYVADKSEGHEVKLDDCIDWSPQVPLFVKMDIEGAETDALRGARRFLHSAENIRLAVCTYHRHGDEQEIKTLLGNEGYHTRATHGLMLTTFDLLNTRPPYFRHGVLQAQREPFAVPQL